MGQIVLSKGFEDYASVADALSGVIENMQSRGREQIVDVKESYARIAARDYLAKSNVPAFPTSHMDGFAVFSADLEHATARATVRLKTKGSGKLAVPSTSSLSHGEAVRVATGGRLPSGADAVLPLESVREDGGLIEVSKPPQSGDLVYPAGADVRKGDLILSSGQLIRAQDVGMLIGLGVLRVKVRSRPTVSVIATGSELSNSPHPPRGKVRNSHSSVLVRLCEGQGCIASDRGVVADDVHEIRRAIQESATDSDFVITLGGTSIGRHDHAGEAVRSLSPDVIFHGLKMDRGRVTGVAVVAGKPVLMAPGPVQGAVNAFILLGIPVIRRLTGTKEREVLVPCKLGSDWKARERFADFQKIVYVKLSTGRESTAEPLCGETESMKVLSQADGFIWVPEDVTRMNRGSGVTVRMLPGFSGF